MTYYVGLDVSLKETQICVLEEGGRVICRRPCVTDPRALARALKAAAPGKAVVVLETGGQSSWLCRELDGLGLEAVIVDARLAKKALSGRVNKTDANDSEGLAWLALTGWYRRVAVKSEAAQTARALLVSRAQLSKQRRALENVIRAQLRGLGVSVGRVSKAGFEARIRARLEDAAALSDAVLPLLAARGVLLAQSDALEEKIEAEASASPVCLRLMSVPGVGPMTALAFATALDDPHRFRRSSSVGAYLGLTPRRFQSGEVSYNGRISKQGDALARHFLYEAANSLLSRVKKWSAPKAWAARLVKIRGGKKARVALARKLAVILHRIWVNETEFQPRLASAVS